MINLNEEPFLMLLVIFGPIIYGLGVWCFIYTVANENTVLSDIYDDDDYPIAGKFLVVILALIWPVSLLLRWTSIIIRGIPNFVRALFRVIHILIKGE